MKKYAFFVGGCAGKGDTWSYDLDVELTDEEAERIREYKSNMIPDEELDEVD